MALTTDWLNVEGDAKLSHAERLGFSKEQIESFIHGKFKQDEQKKKIQNEIDDLV